MAEKYDYCTVCGAIVPAAFKAKHTNWHNTHDKPKRGSK